MQLWTESRFWVFLRGFQEAEKHLESNKLFSEDGRIPMNISGAALFTSFIKQHWGLSDSQQLCTLLLIHLFTLTWLDSSLGCQLYKQCRGCGFCWHTSQQCSGLKSRKWGGGSCHWYVHNALKPRVYSFKWSKCFIQPHTFRNQWTHKPKWHGSFIEWGSTWKCPKTKLLMMWKRFPNV